MLEGWPATLGWKDALLVLLQARQVDGSLQELTKGKIKSAVDGIRTLLEGPEGEGTMCYQLGVAVRKDLLKADPLRVMFAEHVLEVNAAERRGILASWEHGDELMYHSGEEGEVDEDAAPCFVVDSEETGQAEKAGICEYENAGSEKMGCASRQIGKKGCLTMPCASGM